MYLSESQLQLVLQNPFYSQPSTESTVNYVYYRGHINATVHTLRFNMIDSFSQEFMLQRVFSFLLNMYELGTVLLGSISYDVLLVEPKHSSYYVWRANSNSRFNYVQQETSFRLTYNNLYQIVDTANNVHVPSLDLYFQSSSVQIERVLAIVLSFVKM